MIQTALRLWILGRKNDGWQNLRTGNCLTIREKLQVMQAQGWSTALCHWWSSFDLSLVFVFHPCSDVFSASPLCNHTIRERFGEISKPLSRLSQKIICNKPMAQAIPNPSPHHPGGVVPPPFSAARVLRLAEPGAMAPGSCCWGRGAFGVSFSYRHWDSGGPNIWNFDHSRSRFRSCGLEKSMRSNRGVLDLLNGESEGAI
jgi:hypothetical protein